jgi:hypothetical protein
VTLFYNITGIVIISESSIDAAGVYDQPDVISISNIEDGGLIRSYSNNEALMQHEYLTDINYVLSLGTYYSYLTLLYLGISCGWIWLTWFKYKEEASGLQRGLTLLPILKLIHVFSYGSYVRECPWPDQF